MIYDTKSDFGGNRMWCDAWSGARSPAFRKFIRDFSTGASATFLSEDDWSLWQAMTDLDQGGQGPNADAMPGPNQAGHANAVRRRRRRQAKAYECVYRHIEDDRLKEMLHALPNNDRRGAAAWALLKAQCDQGANDLVTLDIKKDYQNLSVHRRHHRAQRGDAHHLQPLPQRAQRSPHWQ